MFFTYLTFISAGVQNLYPARCLLLLSCQTINFGNISDNWNLIIIITSSQERIGSPDITIRSPVVYSRTLSK